MYYLDTNRNIGNIHHTSNKNEETKRNKGRFKYWYKSSCKTHENDLVV